MGRQLPQARALTAGEVHVLMRLLSTQADEHEAAAERWESKPREVDVDKAYEVAHASGRSCGAGLALGELTQLVEQEGPGG